MTTIPSNIVATCIGKYIAQHGDQPLYAGPQGHWVGVDASGTLMLFPAQLDGWARRKPYRGHRSALGPLVSVANAIYTGYPVWERAN